MCNSYSNGFCLYYGVKVSELNNKCNRGDCMDKERLIHLKENCSLVRPNMKELKELYEYILNRELPGSDGPWTATQMIIVQYVDEYISKLEE